MPTPSVYAKQVARIQELELTEERQEEEIQDLTSQLETCARERNDALEACIRLNSELEGLRLANGALIRSNRELRERLTQLRKIGEQIHRNGPWESLGELLKKGV